MGADDPQGGTNFDPRGMIRRIYLKIHITLLQIKYRSFGSCAPREDFTCISHYQTMTDDDAPGAGPVWTPGALLALFIKILLYIATHKIWKFWTLWFQKRRFLNVCPIVGLWELMTLEVRPFLAKGAWFAG